MRNLQELYICNNKVTAARESPTGYHPKGTTVRFKSHLSVPFSPSSSRKRRALPNIDAG